MRVFANLHLHIIYTSVCVRACEIHTFYFNINQYLYKGIRQCLHFNIHENCLSMRCLQDVYNKICKKTRISIDGQSFSAHQNSGGVRVNSVFRYLQKKCYFPFVKEVIWSVATSTNTNQHDWHCKILMFFLLSLHCSMWLQLARSAMQVQHGVVQVVGAS